MADSYVGKPCPKCKHVRAATEIAPDWQCPKCGVAYAKFLQAQQGGAAPAASPGMRAAAGSAPAAASAPSQEGGPTGMAMFAHLSLPIGWVIPFFGLIVPIVIWVVKRGEDERAVSCAKEALNFQISLLLWILLLGAAILLSMMVVPPLVYVFGLLAVILVIASLVLPIIATVKASGGEIYSYPYTWHLFS